VAIYERGVQALQRHDYGGAAGYFRTVLERYPEERELLERARLYLRVCERETSRQPAEVKTPAERVYAATVALNSGDHSGALDHLQRALGMTQKAITLITSWRLRSACETERTRPLSICGRQCP
jgi:uncharacterized protein HemY